MRSGSFIIYGLLAVVGGVGLFLLLETTTDWRWYWNWLIAAGVVDFLFYGLDKALA